MRLKKVCCGRITAVERRRVKMEIVGIADKIINFISEVGVELKKSAWPTRPELIESTVVVIASVVILAIFVGICDLILMRLLKLII